MDGQAFGAVFGRVTAFCCLAAAVFCASGCGDDEGLSTIYLPVKGKVSFRGRPLSGGMIVFVPDEGRGASGPLARSPIQNDGSYELHTDETRGVIPGMYRVAIAGPPVYIGDGFDRASDSRIPSQFRNPQTSGIERAVESDAANQIDFDISE